MPTRIPASTSERLSGSPTWPAPPRTTTSSNVEGATCARCPACATSVMWSSRPATIADDSFRSRGPEGTKVRACRYENRPVDVLVDRHPSRRFAAVRLQHEDIDGPPLQGGSSLRPARADCRVIRPHVRWKQLQSGVHERPHGRHGPLDPRSPDL